MPKVPRKAASSEPFPFVRQFTAPPFFVDLDDAKRKSQLLLDAVQHAEPHPAKPPANRKAVKKGKARTASVKRR